MDKFSAPVISVPTLLWPSSELLESLLAAELFVPWLTQAIEASVVREDPSALSPAQSSVKVDGPWFSGLHDDWVEWCRHWAIDPDCLASCRRRCDGLQVWKNTNFAAQAREHFLEQGARLDLLCFSILQANDSGMVQEWFFKLTEGEARFEDLAPQSIGAERQSAGRVGPVRLGDIQPPVDRLLSRSAVGQVQPPLTLPSGRTIVLRLDHRQPASWDDATRDLLVERLHRRWLNHVITHLRELRPVPGMICPLPLP